MFGSCSGRVMRSVSHFAAARKRLISQVQHLGKEILQPVVVGICAYDGSSRFWTWWSPLAEDIWGHGQDAEGARQGCEAWLRGWLENFRPFFT